MTEREQIISHMDAIVDTYQGGILDPVTLLEVRRDLAVHLYRLTAFVREVHGQAGLTYARRKWAVAKEVVTAQAADAKLAVSKAEYQASTLASVIESKEAEVWADADREALKAKIDATKQVLQSMQQDVAHLSHEAKTTHYQTANTQ
jgi:hypothetical protein